MLHFPTFKSLPECGLSRIYMHILYIYIYKVNVVVRMFGGREGGTEGKRMKGVDNIRVPCVYEWQKLNPN
jgi:hypothetical protein